MDSSQTNKTRFPQKETTCDPTSGKNNYDLVIMKYFQLTRLSSKLRFFTYSKEYTTIVALSYTKFTHDFTYHAERHNCDLKGAQV